MPANLPADIGSFDLVQLMQDQAGVIFAVAVVVIGLVVYGFRDLFGFSWRRAWAIGGVCYMECRRRHVLWVSVLAIVGVLIVCQMQHPIDEQDAVRQTAKLCVFASGLVLVLTLLVLACTNLPREIETRVIYTIVSKPATRLEIIVGKLMGLARISAIMVIIMGVFTAGYLQVRSWSMERSIQTKLSGGLNDPSMTATLQHYQQAGLLSARTLVAARQMQIVAKEPGGDGKQWVYGGDQSVYIPFAIDRERLTPLDDPSAQPASAGLAIILHIGFEPTPLIQRREEEIRKTTGSTQPSEPEPPQINVSLMDVDEHNLVDCTAFDKKGTFTLNDPTGNERIVAFLPPEQTGSLIGNMPDGGIVYVNVNPIGYGYRYSFKANAVQMVIPPAQIAKPERNIPPVSDVSNDLAGGQRIGIGSEQLVIGPEYRTLPGTFGYQLRGDSQGLSPMAVYCFRDVRATPAADGTVPFELRMGIERGGEEGEVTTQASIDIGNPQHTGSTYHTTVTPDIGRTLFFSVPADKLGDGNFDVTVRCTSNGQYLGVARPSLYVVSSEESYLWNLSKSMGILWLLSVMVIVVALFCSTFVSWPIAVILTLVILLSHWGVTQLGDSLSPGLGRQVMSDLFGGSAGSSSTTQSISATIDAMAKSVRTLSKVLPDIGQFSAVDDLDRGVALPMSRLLDALTVLGLFGVPMLVLSYVVLRNKEVAP